MTFCQLLASSCLYVAHSLALMIATTRLSHCSMLPPLVASHELNDFFFFLEKNKKVLKFVLFYQIKYVFIK